MANHKPKTNRSNCSPEGFFFFGNRHWLASRSNSLKQRGEKKKANGSMGSQEQAKEDQIRSNKWQSKNVIIRGQMVGEQMGMV
jgi:hypothetical protein